MSTHMTHQHHFQVRPMASWSCANAPRFCEHPSMDLHSPKNKKKTQTHMSHSIEAWGTVRSCSCSVVSKCHLFKLVQEVSDVASPTCLADIRPSP